MNNFSKIIILVDENTHEHCLSHFLSNTHFDSSPDIIEIPQGEVNKTIETCLEVWRSLSELSADRKSLLINLGGGVVTDLGGFVASTFKRGIKFINIPTSLLAMVDSSIGGKTGINSKYGKNLIGSFYFTNGNWIATFIHDEHAQSRNEEHQHHRCDRNGRHY